MAAVKYKVGEAEYSADQLVALGSSDPDLFYQIFFPKTVRQGSAPFHLELDAVLEDPSARFVLAKMFRGSAKTTRLRMFTGRRIAYGLSHTILFVSASEGHATRSIRWLKKQVEFNKPFSSVFGLKPGSKWRDEEIEVVSTITGDTCWLLGAGITGNIRGINFDDYRPDLIVVDDAITDENAATKEQRDKIIDLFEGALKGSLTPATEDPNAKMVVAQTPMNLEDAVAQMEKSRQWRVLNVPIWTPETVDLPVEQQESAWPERLPTETVRAEKKAAASVNKLSIWTREHEVRLITPELRAFKPEWLNLIDIMPTHTYNVLSIDPLPPPSDKEVAKGMKDKDFEAIGVLGRYAENYYLKEYEVNQGHDPSWTVAKVFELCERHGVMKIIIEGVAYQKTLKWILEQEMRRRGKWFQVDVITDRRPKYHKIVQGLNGVASQGRLFVKPDMVEFISQFTNYPQVSHDDVLDMVAQGLTRIINPALEMGGGVYEAMVANASRTRSPRLVGCP